MNYGHSANTVGVFHKGSDGLRLLIVVGACGAFVAVRLNRAEIVLAHAKRQSSDLFGEGVRNPRPKAGFKQL
jgi:hypothetical protein